MNYKSISKELKRSLRGRIKLKVLQNISKSKKRFPSKSQIKSFIDRLNGSPNDPCAKFLYSVITDNQANEFEYYNLLITNELEPKHIEYVENNLLDDCTILTFKNCNSPLPKELCVWVIKSPNTENFGLTIFICGEDSPDLVEGIFAISHQKENKKIDVKAYQAPISKFGTHLSDEKKDDFLMGMVMRIPHFFAEYMPTLLANVEVAKNPNTTSRIKRSYERPLDLKLIKYLREVSEGNRKCYKAKVSINDIFLYDIDYTLTIPDNAIESFIRKIDNVKEYGLLTYEKGGKFIVSDDYELYLAMRITEMDFVNIVNLGEITSSVKILKEGGLELIPPMMSKYSKIDASEEFKTNLLDNKIELFKRSRKLKELMFDNYGDIKALIMDNKLEGAIEELMKFTQKDELKNELTATHGQLKKLKSDIRVGVIDYDTETINFNKVRINILRILNEI